MARRRTIPDETKTVEQLTNKSIPELLALHASVMDELRGRDVLRSENNPTGDLAEFLFCKAYGWTQASNSEKGFDATDGTGKRYQIKGRRLNRHRRDKSRQLSAIRDFEGFDFLAATLFDHDYRVERAALIPRAVVQDLSTYYSHTNSHRFLLRDEVWEAPEVVDVTDRLLAVIGGGKAE